LNGYGGFNVDMLPHFNSTLFPWLERGGIYALPNLRGGGEFGRDWHEAGRRHNKQNVFDDFIAAAEHLIARGYTTRGQLAISGRSNGGLLVGAAMTQRPDLFGAVLCGVPVLDMLRFHRVGIGTAWVPEYGDVSKEDDFRALFAYSPYHRLSAETHYPPTLVLSADADDRVDPMHARKFVARLLTTRDPRALLRIERNAGHGGADLRRQLIERSADEFAFLLSELAP
jgi:prolyl oligopeptidase